MKIRLLAFASAYEALGTDDLRLDMPKGATVGDLKARLSKEHPRLGELWERLAIALDGEVVGDTARLSDGAEVALLPPVSGGSDAAPRVAIVTGPIDLAALIASVASPARGAVVTFLGTVRDRAEDRTVTGITYHGYQPMALARLEAVARELEASASDLAVGIVHRLGKLLPGEASVAIVTASAHRATAYRASRSALERLKAEVPIWKHEHYADGDSAWREVETLSRPEAAALATP